MKIDTYWLSFSDDDGFRGAVIIDAISVHEAFFTTHLLKINPGGQVAITKLNPRAAELPRNCKNKLLNYDEIMSLCRGEIVRVGIVIEEPPVVILDDEPFGDFYD